MDMRTLSPVLLGVGITSCACAMHTRTKEKAMTWTSLYQGAMAFNAMATGLLLAKLAVWLVS